ncbi:MAG TPA: ABC transporter substrate-binding protein [Streptosporangiaceae bacterium]|nr:ABC transporter substrate-binding protein [Streptosporangiaceae bacterium]
MSLTNRTRILSAGLTALAIGAVAACSGPATPAGTGTSTGAAPSSGSGVDTLVIANAVKVDTLDPEANSVNESIWLDQNLYSRLLQPNATGTALLPDLATSWDISANGLSYTFHLRPDAQFTDGSPVTASDVVYSIERSRKFSGGWGFLLTAVKTITAPDPHTVVVTLSQPHAPLLADLAMYAYSVVPEKLVKAQGAAFFQHPVGSGPFMVTSFSADSEVDLARNPHFYGTKPKISKVKVLIVPDDNSRVLMLESKKADVIENPPGNLVNQINSTPGLSVQLFPSTRVDFIQLDQHYKPFKSQLVREALNYAIDRNAIVKLAYQGHATPGASFMPYKMEFFNSGLQPYKYDPAKAKQLLAQAGYPHGFNTFLITVSGDVAGQAEAVVVKSELAAVGINVSIQSYELLTAYDKEDNGHSQMGERYWTNDIIDPDEVATFGADCKGGANAFNSYWCSTQATSLVNQARAERDNAARQQMYGQIQQIIYDQSPFLVIDYSPYRYGVGGWVHGFHVTPLGNYQLSLETLTVSSH